ncbi:MAG: imidazoleglycerol-phosphate dehydratase HisB [Sphaerochaetaceae bacterium]|nr:imidazoleglycerol-phosphate dehydratase HisB [Sphaerochaetaceae bacterium]MDY0371281.1 imidazoleglycerol-phosphate dehydratase HisB [Sphaerochaetaceae bacterium]
MTRRLATIFLALEGPVIATTSLRSFADLVWTSEVFSSLYTIMLSGRYRLVVFLQEEHDQEVLQRVFNTLSSQGIAVEQVLTNKELPDFDIALYDNNHSLVIASNPEHLAKKWGFKGQVFSDWKHLESMLLGEKVLPPRRARIVRQTKETAIRLDLQLDGTGQADIETGLPFFDHMLHQVARHGRIDMTLRCHGDLEVDEHHSVEDVAIVLGQAVAQALGDKRGISRYGFEIVPMDECLAQVALDFSGRPWFDWKTAFTRPLIGTFPTELLEHFFKSFSDESKSTLHMEVNAGNAHHQAEALFKAFGRALRTAVFRYPDNTDLPSTKGVL